MDQQNPGLSRLELIAMANSEQQDDLFNDNRLPAVEAEFLTLVKAGEVEDVEDFIMRNPSVDVNIRDYMGITPLSIAVRSENMGLVEVLLKCRSIRLEDSLLHAVKLGNLPIVESLLRWCDNCEAEGNTVDLYFESSEFLPHMSPLMLACHQNNYEIVRILLRHGHTLEDPSTGHVTQAWKAIRKSIGANADSKYGETLELGKLRIDSYKAVASPVYMGMTSQDPLYQAFIFSHIADKLGYEDPIFNDDYKELSSQCREFAVKILEECRSTEEVRLILAQPHDPKETGIPSSGAYPRLTLAIEYGMKEFITHKNCQQVIQNLWTQEHPNILWMNFVWRLLYFIPHILLLPFVYITYLFFPCAPFLTYWSAPMNKFMGDAVSFFTFLALLFYTIVNTEISKVELGKRVPSLNNGVDVVIWIFVASYLWDHIKLFYFYGIKVYIKDWWNVYTVLMTFSFLTSFAGRLASFIIVETKDAAYRDMARILWPWDDPMLVSEGFYAFGTILAFGRILYLFTISQILGPLQISLGNMITDVLQMMCIMMITMFAFSTGISRMYTYYGGMNRIEDGETTTQSNKFDTWANTFKTLFWDLFGYGDREDPTLIVANTCPSPNSSIACYPPNRHGLTENMGFTIYGIFHLVMITTMLNMLIAMMGNTLGRIQENADVEWKFARSRLWMTYFGRSSLLPNPFNMIPTPYDIYKSVRWCLSCSSSDAGWDRNECCYRIDSEERRQQKEDIDRYKALLMGLMKRYLAQLDIDESATQVTPELLDQTKTDIIREVSRMFNPGIFRSASRIRQSYTPEPPAYMHNLKEHVESTRRKNGKPAPAAAYL